MLKVPLVPALIALAVACAGPAAAQTPAPPPNASFTATPPAPLTLQRITFTAAYQGRPGTQYLWDLNGDGQHDDGSGRTIRWEYPTPGPRTVGLFVQAPGQAPVSGTLLVSVGNRAPRIRAIRAMPGSPVVGEAVRFSGEAEDRDGQIVSWLWELDGDARFDDATGWTAIRSFRSAGRYRVGLKVLDPLGAADVGWAWITVARTRPPPPPPPPPPGTNPPAANPPAVPPASGGVLPAVRRSPRLMSPFPFVRIAGFLRRRGARLTLVLIRGPRGAYVKISCFGAGCPYRIMRTRIGRSGRLRVRSLQRYLRAGVRLELSITQPNRIGKRVTYRIRRGRLPARWDGCYAHGWKRAMRCR